MAKEIAIGWRRISEEEMARLPAAVARVLEAFPCVAAAYLYGSAARGDRPSRDIDLGLVIGGRPPEWGWEAKASNAIAIETGIRDVPFDVRALNGGSPVFLHRVLREGKLLYEHDRAARLRFETQAMSDWLDFRPVWERMRREVLGRWARE